MPSEIMSASPNIIREGAAHEITLDHMPSDINTEGTQLISPRQYSTTSHREA